MERRPREHRRSPAEHNAHYCQASASRTGSANASTTLGPRRPSQPPPASPRRGLGRNTRLPPHFRLRVRSPTPAPPPAFPDARAGARRSGSRSHCARTQYHPPGIRLPLPPRPPTPIRRRSSVQCFCARLKAPSLSLARPTWPPVPSPQTPPYARRRAPEVRHLVRKSGIACCWCCRCCCFSPSDLASAASQRAHAFSTWETSIGGSPRIRPDGRLRSASRATRRFTPSGETHPGARVEVKCGSRPPPQSDDDDAVPARAETVRDLPSQIRLFICSAARAPSTRY